MRVNEIAVETRDRMFEYLKKILPMWPDYILRDWIYQSARGDHQVFAPDAQFGFDKRFIYRMLNQAGLSPTTKWTYKPQQKFHMMMWEPETLSRLQKRWGGASHPSIGVTNDQERHATQAALATKQGGIRREPVILTITSKGYELIEGWHRTIQHFKLHPEGYIGPAWVAKSSL